MREESVEGVGSVGGNPKEYKGVLKIGFGISSELNLVAQYHCVATVWRRKIVCFYDNFNA